VVVLFIGDIVGSQATAYVATSMPELRSRHHIDLVIANAENSAPCGLGMSSEQRDMLLNGGVDVITGGNHSWDGPGAQAALSHPRVLRPHNLMAGAPGTGLLHLRAGEHTVTVLNLADQRILDPLDVVNGSSLAPYQCWLACDRRGDVIVDFHGEHVIEKQVFAHAVDGRAAAVLGTHTHEPTLPLHILPGGTALVTDVGMTGPLGGVQGFDADIFAGRMRSGGDYLTHPLPQPRQSSIALSGVLLDIKDGRTRRLSRLGHDWSQAPVPAGRC
jgi:metallophosphoesterase (TIGR00282 family)